MGVVISGPRSQHAMTHTPATRLGGHMCHRSCQAYAAHAMKIARSSSMLTCAPERCVQGGYSPKERRYFIDKEKRMARGNSRGPWPFLLRTRRSQGSTPLLARIQAGNTAKAR